MSTIFLRGFKLDMGSWKIICIFCLSILSVDLSRSPDIFLPLKIISPSVGSYSRMILRPIVVLPEPDSPTSPNVSPG